MARAKPAQPPTELDDEPIGRRLCERVHELRRKKGWTLEQTSAACGVSRSMLSEIERGRANPTLAVAYRIAQAFGMSLGELVDAPAASSRVEVIRADDRTYHYRSDRNCRIRTLSPLHLEKSVEYYEITLRAGGALRSQPHFEGARELLTVLHGDVRVTSGADREDLSRGDSAHYPADVPHAIENVGAEEATVYLVVTYTGD
ncbi:MAG TPA: XRE family transcriptional regulator [Tepidisphaeraceae bacterium]|nr:XRE family transcriptional regulator [Tepidisphaeraceae bacterium]